MVEDPRPAVVYLLGRPEQTEDGVAETIRTEWYHYGLFIASIVKLRHPELWGSNLKWLGDVPNGAAYLQGVYLQPGGVLYDSPLETAGGVDDTLAWSPDSNAPLRLASRVYWEAMTSMQEDFRAVATVVKRRVP